ncbi:MAG TPA: hypothetical protein VMT71_12800 [Syntrophorhabdales bacterium]|nr:hypothetical protein [Syntrophorhabdales bacterium]
MLQHNVRRRPGGISPVLFILLGGVLFFPCTSVGSSLDDPGSQFYLHKLPPSPTPGMAVILNLNAANDDARRDVEIVGVFQGWFSEKDLVGVDTKGNISVKMGCIGFLREGNMLFAKESLGGVREAALTWSFVLPGGFAGPTGVALFLPPRRAQYTLLVRYKDVHGRYIAVYGEGEEAIRFRTTGYSFESQTVHHSARSQTVVGDPIVRLPLVDASYPPLSAQYIIDTSEMVRTAITRMAQRGSQAP